MVSKLQDRSKAWTMTLRFALSPCFHIEYLLDALRHVDLSVDLVVMRIQWSHEQHFELTPPTGPSGASTLSKKA